MTETESRQARRARQRAEASPPRLFDRSPRGNRATRRAPARRPVFADHPTKRRAPVSDRRLVAQLAMAELFRRGEARKRAAIIVGPALAAAIENRVPTFA